MNSKTIRITINIPENYKWLAIQPWGGITLFTKKPKIYVPDDVDDGGYWGNNGGLEFDVTGEQYEIEELNKPKNWRKTLIKL